MISKSQSKMNIVKFNMYFKILKLFKYFKYLNIEKKLVIGKRCLSHMYYIYECAEKNINQSRNCIQITLFFIQ